MKYEQPPEFSCLVGRVIAKMTGCQMPICEYCGFGPHTTGTKRGHYWSCPNNPEMVRLRPQAERVVAAMVARRRPKHRPTSPKQMGQLTLAPRRNDGKTVEGFFHRK